MKSNLGLVLLFMVLMTITIISAFYFLIFDQNASLPRRAIVCENDGPTISFLINEKTQEVIMLGEKINPSSITIFNQAAISAKWSHKKGDTKIFLDRIAGKLEVENTANNGLIDKQKFKCMNTTIRF